jgi:hypothetical protein
LKFYVYERLVKILGAYADSIKERWKLISTYRAPAPTRATNLKNGIAVVDIRFAVPLCSWHKNLILNIFDLYKHTTPINSLEFIHTTTLFCRRQSPVVTVICIGCFFREYARELRIFVLRRNNCFLTTRTNRTDAHGVTTLG